MIPKYEEIMRPLLEALDTNGILTLEQCTQLMADHFKLAASEREEMLKKGNQTVIKNRTGWAKFYLDRAGLLKTVSRGKYEITEEGKKVLVNYKGMLDVNYLITIPQFSDFIKRASKSDDVESGNHSNTDVPSSSKTPDEILEEQYNELNQNLADDILQRIMEMSPSFFERLVIQLLESMGYGKGKVTGRTGDEGIDGVIGEDKLGLDVIHIQAKRWTPGNKVGRKELQSFVGALAGQSGRKGVFITTSDFTKEARDYNPANVKIAKINGNTLAHLMIEHNVGVSIKTTYEIKRVDLDFYTD